MKKAIFRNVLVALFIFATVSGFSFSSSATEKVRGFVISSNIESTIKKVNDRILDSAKGSREYNSYVVNVDNYVDFSLASLLSLKNNGVVVSVSNGKIDESFFEILKNSKKVYIVGDEISVKDDVLNDLDLSFERLGSKKASDTNEIVNKFQGKKDLLVVDKKENSDILGSVHFANIYDMNLLFVDSTKKITKYEKSILSSLKEDDSVYFYDGVNVISSKYKEDIFKELKRNTKEIENFNLDAKNLLKVFKDRVSVKNENKDLVISKNTSLVDMIYSYVFSQKKDLNYLLVDENNLDKDIEDLVKELNFKNIFFVSTENDEKFLSIRLFMSLKNASNFANFEINDETLEITSVDTVSKKSDTNSVSEEVSVNEDEEIVDGKVTQKKKEDSKIKKEEIQKTENKSFSYKKVLTMTSTAYSSDGNDPLTPGHITALGQDLWENPNAVAVDTSVIPLGTRLYVEGYGYTVASDTGSFVKGNVIDLHFKTTKECNRWGKKIVKVYVLD